MSSQELYVQRFADPSPERPKRRMRSAWVIGFVLLAGCGTQRTPDHYTASVGTNFIRSCVAQSSALSTSQKTCTCTYNEIKKSIKFSRFKQINSALTEKPAALPSDITNILDNCKTGVETGGASQSTGATTSTTAG